MNDYFATVGRGLEAVASRELESLGAQKVSPAFAGVHFSGDQRLLYRVNLWGRTLFRVLVPLRDFRCVDATILAVMNTGHSIQVNYEPGSSIEINGQT